MMDSESNSFLQEKLWHLLALLLWIGYPVDAESLSSRCSFFNASPDFVRYVASLPDSPLSVNRNGLLTPSARALFALARFFYFSFPDSLPSPFRKRKSIFSFTEGGRDPKRLAIGDGVREISFQSIADTAKAVTGINLSAIKFDSRIMHGGNSVIPLRIGNVGECSGFPAPNFEDREVDNDAIISVFGGEVSGSVMLAGLDRFRECNRFVNLPLSTIFRSPLLCNEGAAMDYSDTFGHECPEQNIIHSAHDDGVCKSSNCKDPLSECNENEEVESDSKKGLVGKKDVQRVNPVERGEEPVEGLKLKKDIHNLDLDKNKTKRNMVTQSTNEVSPSSSNPKQLLKSSCIFKGGQKNDLHSKTQILTESLPCNKFDNVPKKFDQCKNDQKFIAKHKLKQSRKENMAENKSMTSKVEKKAYPSFETFTIEEEEGSGGYGTVYRAQRTTDGKRLAIKCPHSNAPKNHVNNERNMLERFGGKNFIIKFEGSFKSGSSDCFVLEHVEHDRPEVLKKEIDIGELQWYGYCMFKALACLHKEGVVHRDVKPGNFLFSRKLKKGYLIDFNLAMDLKPKYNFGCKSKPSLDASNTVPLSSGSAPVVQDKNLGGSKSISITPNKRELADYRKYSELNRHVKQKTNASLLKNCPNKAGTSLLRAQGTDASGITSVKDVTSTKTASVERIREPLPFLGTLRFLGRKELISLVQNSMQCANNSPMKGPSSQRKRVTAPSGKVDGRILYPSPMPVHSSTAAMGSLKSKGDGKHKREGSCVGTKGFRAPEVLFRSQFQGPKVDIWSAGVTLLYMVIGKTPFSGEPEQNIKDIAKLRGSEELWEVAKLHDRETSFPVELLDDRYLQSCDIESWCKKHTKRPEFLEHVPKSLFDLIDKCLIVNPRSRISVEEVLRHEFFAPCNEIMRKHRMSRRGPSSETTASTAI